MKITSVWRGNKPNHKKKRTVPKLRIRWTQLGLVDPSVDSPETPMDEIRRAVTNLGQFRVRCGDPCPLRTDPGTPCACPCPYQCHSHHSSTVRIITRQAYSITDQGRRIEGGNHRTSRQNHHRETRSRKSEASEAARKRSPSGPAQSRKTRAPGDIGGR
jgi:hypothetical protein